jgi:hypothetical protein
MNTDHVVVQGSDMWCKACGKREPLLLPLSVKDFSIFVQSWTEQHKACASYSKRGDKQVAASAIMQALARIARLGPEAQELSLDARHAFEEYQRADPRTVVAYDSGRSVCLHCGKPYENKEQP